jgi:hypothetical protein
MRNRAVVITLFLLIVGTLIAVSTIGASKSQYHSSIKGQLLLSGGPSTSAVSRPSGGQVTARNASGQSFVTSVPSSGSFVLQLPAGRYSLTGSSPQFGGGQYECFGHVKINVSKGKTTRQNAICEEK